MTNCSRPRETSLTITEIINILRHPAQYGTDQVRMARYDAADQLEFYLEMLQADNNEKT